METSPPASPGSAPARLIVEIEGSAAGSDDVPRGRVGDGRGPYVDFHGWSSLAAAIEHWRVAATRPGEEGCSPTRGGNWQQDVSGNGGTGLVRAAPDPYFRYVMELQGIKVDPEKRRVWRAGEELRLSRKEFDLLHVLMEHAGEIVSRDDLMRLVWHTSFWTSSKTIDVHLGWLRRKIGDDARRPHLITTIRGRGLRFERVAVLNGAD